MKIFVRIAFGVFVILFFNQCSVYKKISDSWEYQFIGQSKDLVFFPDWNANYWTYTIKNKLNLGYKITGQWPQTRYFGFNLYDDRTRSSIGSLSDSELWHGKNEYEMFIVPENYVGTEKNQSLYYNTDARETSSVFLRNYLPENNLSGGVSLPQIEAFELDSHQKVALPHKKFNKLGAKNLHNIYAWRLSKKINRNLFQKETKKLIAYKNSGKGFYENFDNTYLVIPIKKNNNEVAILRFKPPVISASNPESVQMRYWSFSECNLKTVNYYTLRDEQFKVNHDGYIYILIGGNLKTNVEITYNQMDWKVNDDKMILIYRNLLPVNAFPYAIGKVPEKAEAKDYIGDYAPVGFVIPANEFKKNGFNSLK